MNTCHDGRVVCEHDSHIVAERFFIESCRDDALLQANLEMSINGVPLLAFGLLQKMNELCGDKSLGCLHILFSNLIFTKFIAIMSFEV